MMTLINFVNLIKSVQKLRDSAMRVLFLAIFPLTHNTSLLE